MNTVFFATIHNYGASGLCNQLLSFLNAITICIQQKKEILVIDSVLNEIHTNVTVPAHTVFDFDRMNAHFQKHYNLKITDKTKNPELVQNQKPTFTWIFSPLKLKKHLGLLSPYIYFQPEFEQKAVAFTKQLPQEENINIFHLRMEKDGIVHWSKQNRISYEDYESKLTQLYIEALEKYIRPTDHTIILSYRTSNTIIDWLKEKKYNFSFINKEGKWGRELNGIVDLLISEKCNNVFIGNLNPMHFNGSTFSWMVGTRLKQSVHKVMIDPDNLKNGLIVSVPPLCV